MSDKRVYIAYTGGTIGMHKSETGYAPAEGYLAQRMTGIKALHHPDLPRYSFKEYSPLLDSANMRPANWQAIAHDIAGQVDAFDGFIVLHGTDTMAYTASALSFMLEGLNKPVILTGAQIPLIEARSDARENLITAMLLAANYAIPEVCLYFSGYLFRGNRATKVSSSGFDAFDSPNCPPLAEVGVSIEVDQNALWRGAQADINVRILKDIPVGALRLFPGITAQVLDNMLRLPLQGLVLETYGSGNVPAADTEFLDVIERACARGVVIVNCSQCLRGGVDMSGYETGAALRTRGVVSGFDMTPEAALCKLIYLLSSELSVDEVRQKMQENLRGELTPLG